MKSSIDKTVFLSISEAAELLGVHPETLRNWHKRGLLKPFVTLGGHRRYAKADVEKLLINKISLTAKTQFKTRKSISKFLFEQGEK